MQPPVKKYVYRNKSDLSEDVIKQIEFENVAYGLESGQFYDGCHFRDEDGQIIARHPSNISLLNK